MWFFDFTGRIDGEAFEGVTAQGHMLELGSNSFILVEDGLVMQKQEKRWMEGFFSADYKPHLAGEEAFERPGKKFWRGEAKVDDALASKLGFENLDALREAVVGQLALNTQRLCGCENDVFDQLADQMDFDVPPSSCSQNMMW